jgi:hypothetical protein
VPRANVSSGKSPSDVARTLPTQRELEQWEVTMHDLARDLSGQLDSKIRVLELLIREAEKAAARLETSLARVRGNGESLRGSVRAAAAPASENPARQLSQGDPAEKLRFDRIYALHDAGLSAAKIASQIGSQVGEVELILGIRGEGREKSA